MSRRWLSDDSGAPAPGYSTGQAVNAMERLAAEVLPAGMTFEWTELTHQEKQAGNAGLWVFPLAVLLAYLILAAQYNSWTLPLAVLLIVPLALLMLLIGFGVNTLFISMYLRPKIAADRSRVLNFYWMLVGLVTGVYTFGLSGILLGPILIGLLKAVIDTVTTSASWRLVDPEPDGDPAAGAVR